MAAFAGAGPGGDTRRRGTSILAAGRWSDCRLGHASAEGWTALRQRTRAWPKLQSAFPRKRCLASILVGVLGPFIACLLQNQRIGFRSRLRLLSLLLVGLVPDRPRPIMVIEPHELRDVSVGKRRVALDLQHILIVRVFRRLAEVGR